MGPVSVGPYNRVMGCPPNWQIRDGITSREVRRGPTPAKWAVLLTAIRNRGHLTGSREEETVCSGTVIGQPNCPKKHPVHCPRGRDAVKADDGWINDLWQIQVVLGDTVLVRERLFLEATWAYQTIALQTTR
jgi:hypothetical protein